MCAIVLLILFSILGLLRILEISDEKNLLSVKVDRLVIWNLQLLSYVSCFLLGLCEKYRIFCGEYVVLSFQSIIRIKYRNLSIDAP